jgi:hypothetical protein
MIHYTPFFLGHSSCAGGNPSGEKQCPDVNFKGLRPFCRPPTSSPRGPLCRHDSVLRASSNARTHKGSPQKPSGRPLGGFGCFLDAQRARHTQPSVGGTTQRGTGASGVWFVSLAKPLSQAPVKGVQFPERGCVLCLVPFLDPTDKFLFQGWQRHVFSAGPQQSSRAPNGGRVAVFFVDMNVGYP